MVLDGPPDVQEFVPEKDAATPGGPTGAKFRSACENCGCGNGGALDIEDLGADNFAYEELFGTELSCVEFQVSMDIEQISCNFKFDLRDDSSSPINIEFSIDEFVNNYDILDNFSGSCGAGNRKEVAAPAALETVRAWPILRRRQE